MVSMSNSFEFLRFRPSTSSTKPAGPDDPSRFSNQRLARSRTDSRGTMAAQVVRPEHHRQDLAPASPRQLGANYTKASAAFIWATIARMYAARRSGLKKEMFGYVPEATPASSPHARRPRTRRGNHPPQLPRQRHPQSRPRVAVKFADGSSITRTRPFSPAPQPPPPSFARNSRPKNSVCSAHRIPRDHLCLAAPEAPLTRTT